MSVLSTRQVMATRGHAGEATPVFLDAGFTAEQALGLIAAFAWVTISSDAHDVTGRARDAPFQPQAWTRPASSRRSA